MSGGKQKQGKEREKASPSPVEVLEKIRGVSRETAEKVVKALGIESVEELYNFLSLLNSDELAEIAGIQKQQSNKIIQFIQKKEKFKPAAILLEEYKKEKILKTGSTSLDNLLGGGIRSGEVTEFAGEYGSGKTQICYTISVIAQLPEERGGLGGKVIWIDTEGTFRPDRVKPIAKRFGIDPKEALNNILVLRAYTTERLLDGVEDLKKNPRFIKENNIQLIIVDSITAPLRAEYLGIDKLAERQQVLRYIVINLFLIARMHNIPVVITNQIVEVPAQYGENKIAVGGPTLAHLVSQRVLLSGKKDKPRKAELRDSAYLPYGEALFKITDQGITDSKK